MLLHRRFVSTAKRFSGKEAFVDRTTGRRITYGKGLIASLILTEKFRRFDPGFIGIMVPNSAGAALSILAALMSGRTPVMINYSTGAEANARYAQRKCNFETIVTSRALLEKISCPVVEGMIFLEDIMAGISYLDKIKAALVSKLPEAFILRKIHGGDPDDNLVILFTSGSEKDPKAVELTHRNVWSNVEAFSSVVRLSHEDRMLAILPYFHVFGLTVNLWAALHHGMSIVLYANPLEYRTICEIVREEKATILAGTPSFLWGYLRKSETGDFASLRIVVSGADKCPEALRQSFLDRHGIKLLEGYGTTETSPVISANTFEDYRGGSIGKVLPGVQVRIEDYETGKECGPGETGRILVRGDLVMKGYLDDFEETSMRIRHGWYDTGDMGYLDEDGFLWHAGRLKRFVKIGGEMVSLVRVEDVLQGILGEEIQCCVVELPDALKGARIIAAVTGRIDEKQVQKRLTEQLPAISLPKQYVVLEELPRMGSGKVDFRQTGQLVQERLKT